MAVPNQGKKPKSTLAILRHSLTLSTKNIHLSLPIYVVSTLVVFLLFTADTFASTPLLTDLLSKAVSIPSIDPASPNYSALLAAIRGDVRELSLVTALFLLLVFLISSFSAVAYIHIVTISYFDKPSEMVNDFLPKLKQQSPKAPLITLLMVSVLGSGYACLLLLAPATFFVLVAPGSVIFILVGVVVVVFLVALYLYLSVLWLVAVVVSVVEPELYGVAAISKAAEVTKGRMKQGVAIGVAILGVSCVIAAAYGLVKYVAPQTMAWQLAITFVYLAISMVMDLFVRAVYTTFYYGCLGSRRDGSGGYHPLLPTAHLGEDRLV